MGIQGVVVGSKKTHVNYWRYETGEARHESQYTALIHMDPPEKGWYCWVQPQDEGEFVNWMEERCPGAEVTWRFNSGDPIMTVHIKDEHEAMLFRLKWSD